MFRKRYFCILWFFGWTILGVIGWDLILPRLGLRRLSRSTRTRRMKTVAQHFRKLAVQMGGVMIKVGQFLSSRLDVLPREITDELSGLQDEVAPEPFEPIRALIESEFGAPLEQKFSDFDRIPLASASIGQVYCAHLCATQADGTPCPSVVVKVQRPHIEEIVEVDLTALRIVGSWLQKYPPISKHVNVPKLLEEFSRSLYEEIDYIHEGKNAETFAENFKDDLNVRVPKVIWSHTTQRVLTLEDVGGIKITDYAAIEAAGIDRAEVATRLLNTYLKQVFEDGFFHADPHPGNLFVQAPDVGAAPGDWKLTFVDFGMTGTLPEQTFKGLREVLISVGTQDAHRLVQAYEMLDVLLPGADVELLERASQRVFERLWGKSTTQMMSMHPEDAREFVDEFGDLLYEMPFQIPEHLILLGRCVSILSGMCSGLNPDFNVWESLAPYAGSLMEAEGGGKWETLLDEVGKMLQKLLALPAKTDSLLSRMEQGRLEVRTPTLTHEVERLNRSQRKTAGAVVFTAFLLGGVQLYVAGDVIPAAGFGAVAALTLLWVLVGR
ncbi:MAG: AarF/ABC1/UbiB kinase family protein [Anaerolineaceae bacterium]|jgi:predicted unusual protein kinase regulating ubiquinone biosynthesis (AarF/ABC1/UbiB family)